MPNNSLDRSGGSVFLNLIGAAKVEWLRAARSTSTFGGHLDAKFIWRALVSLVAFLQSQGYVEIPLKKTATGLIEVEAKVNDEAALLYLDTGAGRTVFDVASAARLHLELRESEAKAAGLGSASHPVQTSIVDDLAIGSFHIISLKTVVMDLSHVNKARAQIGSAACDGVIGADILGSKSAVIDYSFYKLYLKAES